MTNIAEILKNAPQKLKLYSLVYGEVTLKHVDDRLTTENYCIVVNTENSTESFTNYGKKYCYYNDAECILFPSKEHKSWDNWQEVLFKVGDIIICEVVNISENQQNVCCIYNGHNQHHNDYAGYFYCHEGITAENLNKQILLKNARYATQEEREQFFKELNNNGYTWNADTKQIEKIEQQYIPKYKVDNLIINNNGNICDVKKVNEIVTYKDNSIHYRLYNLNSRCVGDYQLKDIDSNFRLVTEEEKIKLISRGDIEKTFTINDLKPFDKVLVRDASGVTTWQCELFQYYNNGNKYQCFKSSWWQCIPYNDETKHLLGTTDDCPDKYKTW